MKVRFPGHCAGRAGLKVQDLLLCCGENLSSFYIALYDIRRRIRDLEFGIRGSGFAEELVSSNILIHREPVEPIKNPLHMLCWRRE